MHSPKQNKISHNVHPKSEKIQPTSHPKLFYTVLHPHDTSKKDLSKSVKWIGISLYNFFLNLHCCSARIDHSPCILIQSTVTNPSPKNMFMFWEPQSCKKSIFPPWFTHDLFLVTIQHCCIDSSSLLHHKMECHAWLEVICHGLKL